MKALRKKTKFWLFFSLGAIISVPIILFLIVVQMYLYAAVYFVFFLFACYGLYYRVYKGMKPKYPEMPPDGKPDIYYAAGIPRPVYEDVRRYPWFFKKKRRKERK